MTEQRKSSSKEQRKRLDFQGNRMKKIEKYVIIDKEGNEAVKMEEVSYEEIF